MWVWQGDREIGLVEVEHLLVWLSYKASEYLGVGFFVDFSFANLHFVLFLSMVGSILETGPTNVLTLGVRRLSHSSPTCR